VKWKAKFSNLKFLIVPEGFSPAGSEACTVLEVDNYEFWRGP
jgi:hypothetical protein